MKGYFLINKPIGISSFKAITRAKDALARSSGVPFKKIKLGHAGTLDPLASGLLLCGVNQGTKLLSYLLLSDKKYTATIHLGQFSETDDEEGGKYQIENKREDVPTRQELENIIEQYTGEITQTPPVYSALKIDGKRACDRVRKGEKIEMKQRTVTVFSIELVKYEYPFCTLNIHCSTGTYIRSLARDIGTNLQTGGYLSFLQRTDIASFSIDNAVNPEEISETSVAPFHPSHFGFPCIIVDTATKSRLFLGQRVKNDSLLFCTDTIAVTFADEHNDIIGMGEQKGQLLIPKKMLLD